MKPKWLAFTIIFHYISASFSQVNYVWNGVTSGSWNVNTNWTPNGIPSSVDNVTIVTGSNPCSLTANTNVSNLTITSGILNPAGFSLGVSGIGSCNGGTVSAGNLNFTGTTLTFAGTIFNAAVSATVGDVYFNGSTFNSPLTVNKTSANNIQSSGNNIYNGNTSITNSGTGYLLLTNNSTKTETFNGPLTLNTTNSGNLYIGYNGNITVSSGVLSNNTAGSASTYLGYNGQLNLNPGVLINAGTFNGGMLYLYKFNQVAGTPQNINTGINGGVGVYTSTLNSAFTVTAGNIYTGNSIYNSTVTLNKTGGVSNSMGGGNTFNGLLTLNHSGSGYWGFGNGSSDIFNGDLYMNNTSNSERIIIGQNSTNNQLNGNVYVTQSGSAQGISIGWSGTAPVCTFASAKSVFVGAGGFTTGYLQLLKVTQSDATPINIATTGSSSVRLQANIFTGPVNISTPDIYPLGGTYNGAVSFIKTGGNSGNHNNGNQNIFNSTLYVENQSNTGYVLLGYNSSDLFNDNITVVSSGSGGISFGWSGGTGTPTLAAGKTISVGAGGYNAGYLQLGSFTQLGSAPINLNLTGTASFYVVNSSIPCLFGGNLTVTSPDLYIRGGTFNGAAVFTKTGGGSNHNNGGLNTFNSTCTINNQSNSGYFMLGYNSADLFNDDIIVSSTGSGGISLGWTGGTGTPTLAAGKTIQVGPAGFSAGYLQLGSFTQLGAASINLNMTGSSAFYVVNSSVPCLFGGAVSVTCPDIYIRGGIFNSATAFTKTGGTSNHNNTVQNIFNSTCTINQQSSGGYFMLGYNSNDQFNDDIILTSSGTGGIYLGWTNGIGTPVLASGKTILVGGAGFNSGFLQLNNFTQLGSAPVNLNFGGASTYLLFANNSSIGGSLNAVVPDVYFNGATFNSSVTVVKTGNGNDNGLGGNTFQGVSSFTNSGGGYLMFGGSNPDVWNNDVNYTNTGTERILPAWNSAGNIFNGNITLNSTASALGIHFCGGGSLATATLTAGKSIQTVSGGYQAGYLILPRFTQLGSAPVSLNLTSTSNYLTIGPNSTIGGVLTVTAPSISNIQQSVFNGAVYVVKTGAANNSWSGGNTYNAVANYTNTGSGYMGMGWTFPDTWNADAVFYNAGSERILPAWSSAGNLFNGDVYVSSSGSAVGIHFGGGGGTSTVSATKSIFTGGSNYTAGYLILRNMTQLGNAAVNLTLTSTANYLQYGPGSLLGGNVSSTSPGLFFQGCTFNGVTTCTKSGTTNDWSSGSNIFNNNTTITNTGSGYILFGNGSGDQFNSVSTFNNLGSSHIYVAYNSSNNIFGGNVTFNNSPASTSSWIYVAVNTANNSVFNGNINVTCNNGAGVSFGSGTGTSTLSAGNIITTSAGIFNSGGLILKNFTQLGSTAQSLTTTGTSYIQYGPSSAFGGNVASTSPGLLFNGCIFSGVTTCTKTGTTNDASIGNNIFNNTSTLTNTGSGYLLFGNGNADQFNSNTTFNNLGSSHIYVAYNSVNNIFGGNILFNNTPTSTGSWIYVASYAAGNSIFNGNITVNNINGAGVNFGSNTGTSILSSGNTISVGSTGFNSGVLRLGNFSQLSSTNQNLITTGTSQIQYGPLSLFNGNITSSSPNVLFTTSTFNSNVSCTKTGLNNDSSPGGNMFNGATTSLINNGTGYLLMANSLADTYSTNITFAQNSSGVVYPNYNTNCTYFGDVTVTSPSATPITFGVNTNGMATFSGSVSQTLNKTTGSANPVFTRLVMNKSSNSLTLNTRANISSALTLNSGVINTTSLNILNMNNNSSTSVGNNLSYINGPMNYDMAFSGTKTLNFPLGKAADWRPAVLTVNHANGTSYTYNSEVFNANAQALGWSMPISISNVSSMHYWDINRSLTSSGAITPTAGLSGSQTIVLYYDANDGVTQPVNLTIAKNTYTALTSWIDIGGTGASITTGSVSSTSSPSLFNSFSRFTLANKDGGTNPLPVELISFEANKMANSVNLNWVTATEINNDYYEVERSRDAFVYEYVGNVKAYGNGNNNTVQKYSLTDDFPLQGVSYYRLKQVDKDKSFKYSDMVSVYFGNLNLVGLYPNPSHGKLTINTWAEGVNVSVVDSQGKEVINGVKLIKGSNEIDLSNYDVGIYYFIIRSGDEIQTTKIILDK